MQVATISVRRPACAVCKWGFSGTGTAPFIRALRHWSDERSGRTDCFRSSAETPLCRRPSDARRRRWVAPARRTPGIYLVDVDGLFPELVVGRKVKCNAILNISQASERCRYTQWTDSVCGLYTFKSLTTTFWSFSHLGTAITQFQHKAMNSDVA